MAKLKTFLSEEANKVWLVAINYDDDDDLHPDAVTVCGSERAVIEYVSSFIDDDLEDDDELGEEFEQVKTLDELRKFIESNSSKLGPHGDPDCIIIVEKPVNR